jgi:co-chaperonin GroES (HSP10)
MATAVATKSKLRQRIDPLRPTAQNRPREALTGNPSGWKPLELHVLVLPDTPSALSSSGLIHLPDEAVETAWYAQHLGTLVAVGGKAFYDWPEADRLAPGARVHINRYQGQIIEGRDGRKYRLMNDKDILAVEDGS